MTRLAVLATLTVLAQPLAAQKAGDALSWHFSNLQQGYCIAFLVSPDDASGLLPDDVQATRLDAAPNAPPALLRVLQDQPEYAAWMPAEVCLYRFGRADIAGSALVAAGGASEMIGVVSYQARVTASQPPNGAFVSLVFTNDKRVAKVTEDTPMQARRVQATFGKAPHGSDERHSMKLGKTTLIWDGHAASDSASVAAPVERGWVLRGSGGKQVAFQWTLNATTSRSMVGALIVQGKDKLAKLMRKSPIRYLGPMYEGGTAELSGIPE